MSMQHTIVVEFSGRSPSYSAGMDVLGGQIVAVAFDGNRLEVADDLLDALQLVRMSAAWHYLSDESKAVVVAAITKATT
jgi:hypothetical protein